MGKTKIPYLDFSWNPISMRCSPISPGCTRCWHLRMANRLKRNPTIPERERLAYERSEDCGTWPKECGQPVLTHRLDDPLHIRKPSRIGVQFMGDWMHPSVMNEMIDEIMGIICDCEDKHTFFTLTKRLKRLNILKQYRPFKNLWLGVTVCNQTEADEKIPILLQIPAAHRWVSYEPALGPVDFEKYLPEPPAEIPFRLECLDWVVAGAETGPGARPADNDWFRSVRDQCRAAGVPYFQKQCTGTIPEDLMVREYPE